MQMVRQRARRSVGLLVGRGTCLLFVHPCVYPFWLCGWLQATAWLMQCGGACGGPQRIYVALSYRIGLVLAAVRALYYYLA
jgi:hypothetical protein